MFAFAHDHLDIGLGVGADLGGLAADALGRPVCAEPVVRRHMFTVGGMLAVAGRPGMGGHTLAFKICLYGAWRDPHPQFLLQKLIRHRVIVASDIDVVIEPGPALLPFSVDVGFHRQGLERGLVQRLEQIPAAGAQMPGDLAIELIPKRADRSVQFIEPEEPPVPQPGHDPALRQQHGRLDLCLVLGLAWPRREHPVKHLSGYQGWVHADGYAGFNGVFGEGKATEVACMAHIRRKFVDVFAAQGSAIAEEAIKRIAQLYGVEKQARGQSPEARAALRQENAKPIFDDLEEWLRDQLPKISGKSPLAKAIRYALGRMPKTRPCLDNGFLELDTDVVEQPLSQIFWVFGGFSRHASTIFA